MVKQSKSKISKKSFALGQGTRFYNNNRKPNQKAITNAALAELEAHEARKRKEPPQIRMEENEWDDDDAEATELKVSDLALLCIQTRFSLLFLSGTSQWS